MIPIEESDVNLLICFGWNGLNKVTPSQLHKILASSSHAISSMFADLEMVAMVKCKQSVYAVPVSC